MMPEIVNEVLGFILAVGLLLWLGASPVIAVRSLKTVTKPSKKKGVEIPKKQWRKISDHIRTTTAPPIEKPSNVIDSCSSKYEINDNFSWNNEHSRSKRKRLLHR